MRPSGSSSRTTCRNVRSVGAKSPSSPRFPVSCPSSTGTSPTRLRQGWRTWLQTRFGPTGPQSRKRWQWIASAAAVIAVVAMVVSSLPTSRQETVWIVESSVSATGTIELESRAWGTAIHLDLADLPLREGYIAWVIDNSGNKQQVAVWGPTDGGVAVLDSTSSVTLDDVSIVAVTGLDGLEPLLTAAG